MYGGLNEFVKRLEREGELVRVKARVDTELEITEVVDRVSKSGGKALLFEQTGCDWPLAINLFGTEPRMAMALGVERLDDLGVRIESMVSKLTRGADRGLLGKMQMLPLLGEASRWLPRNVSGRGECQQVVYSGERIDLSRLPVLKCWPADGGRFITLPMVNTVDALTGVRNVGMYRMQIVDRCTTAMHWQIHKTGARHFEQYKQQGKRMAVSVCLGGDPAYTYASTAPLPDGIDEYLLAGFLRNKPVRLVKCLTNDLRVPADCDFVLEGYVDPDEELFTEGPFGDHTGFYSLEDRYPLFHLTALTSRRDALYPATVVGIPPMEDAAMALATEKIFLAPIRLALQPEITDLYLPDCGVAHNLAIVNIETRYVGQARKVASALWGAGQMMTNKYMIICSTNRSIRDRDVLARLISSVDLTESLIRSEGVLDVLDHATATVGYGGKAALDLTGACIENGLASERCYQLSANRLAICPQLVFEFDERAESLLVDELLWLGLANSDPRRDLRVENGTIVIDATTKRGGKGMPSRFPNPTVSSSETIKKVDLRWNDYGLGELIKSPSLRYMPLTDNEMNAQI